jgi:uncharacterized protein YjbJ (UPF0337 family)
MSKLQKTVDKLAGMSKQAVAEVIGDDKLAEEGKRQQKQAEDKDDDVNLGKIANNLT